MNTLPKNPAIANARSAAGMAKFRKDWGAAGFASLSGMVHESDRARLMAHVEVLRYSRLLALVKGDDEAGLTLACSRNMPTLPTIDAIGDAKLSAANKRKTAIAADDIRDAKDAAALLAKFDTHVRLYSLHRLTAADDPLDDKARAQMIVHANLAHAVFKMAHVLAYSPNVGEVEE